MKKLSKKLSTLAARSTKKAIIWFIDYVFSPLTEFVFGEKDELTQNNPDQNERTRNRLAIASFVSIFIILLLAKLASNLNGIFYGLTVFIEIIVGGFSVFFFMFYFMFECFVSADEYNTAISESVYVDARKIAKLETRDTISKIIRVSVWTIGLIYASLNANIITNAILFLLAFGCSVYIVVTIINIVSERFPKTAY